MKSHATRLAQRVVPLVLAVGLACGSSPAATVDTEARAQSLRAFRLEQLRRQMAPQSVGGEFTPVKPASAVSAASLFERMTGRRVPGSVNPVEDDLLVSVTKRIYQELARFPAAPCCLCTDAAICNDQVFCNGTEICQANVCAPGPAPCDDGLSCSTDSCTENTDTCTHQPPPPAEVASLNVSRSAPASPVATLAWSNVSGATSYNVFRGALAGLGDLACFTSGVTATSTNDDGAVPATAYYYLVTSVACGQSGLGSGWPNSRRLPPTCP
jgi:hypothetical protein